MFPTLLTSAGLLAASFLPHSVVHPASPCPFLASAPARMDVSMAAPMGGDLASVERELVVCINADRARRGLNALVPDPSLVRTARAHCLDMSARGYFSHLAPSGAPRTPMDRYLVTLSALGLRPPRVLLVGENIYYCSAARGEREASLCHQAFMDSPGHRANILGDRFGRVGVGVFQDAQGRFWATEMFSGG